MLAAHTHTNIHLRFLSFSPLYCLLLGRCFFHYPFTQTLLNSSHSSHPLCYLKAWDYKPSPKTPPQVSFSQWDFSVLHRDLSRANVSSLQETALLLHKQHSGAFPESFHSALHFWHSPTTSLLKKDHSHHVVYRTAVRKDGNPITNCFYKDSINNVTNSALHTFAKCTRLES